MTVKLRISRSRDNLDPQSFVPEPRWEEFLQHYADELGHILEKRYRLTAVGVKVDTENSQLDTIECECTMNEECPHKEMICWINDSESWLKALDHALEKTGLG